MWVVKKYWVHPSDSDGEESACNVGDPGLIPGLGRSRGEGNGNLLQYSCLGNPMDGGAWRATIHRSQRVGHDPATNTSTSHPYFKGVEPINLLRQTNETDLGKNERLSFWNVTQVSGSERGVYCPGENCSPQGLDALRRSPRGICFPGKSGITLHLESVYLCLRTLPITALGHTL